MRGVRWVEKQRRRGRKGRRRSEGEDRGVEVKKGAGYLKI